MKISIIAAALALCSSASFAATIGTYTQDFQFLQSGTISNTSGLEMTGFQIDFVADAGTPATGVWETGSGGLPGTPAATFSNLVSGGAFTATWSGLSIASGSSFSYSNMDYGGFNGTAASGGLIPAFLGDETMTIFFANGSSVSAFLPAGDSRFGASTVLFDDADLVTGLTPVPLPAAFPLMLVALGGLGIAARRRKTA